MKKGEIVYDDESGGMACTVHRNVMPTTRDADGAWHAEPTNGGSYLWQCPKCGAAAWSGV